MLHHLSIAVADLERAARFYDAALTPLGYVRVWSAETAVGYGVEGGGDRFAIKHRDDTVRAPSPGFHVAFSAPSRDAVRAFHAAAVAHGGRDDGAPGLREHYGPTYFAAFVIDPDGYPVEAVFKGPA